jgi:hypothetical protein
MAGPGQTKTKNPFESEGDKRDFSSAPAPLVNKRNIPHLSNMSVGDVRQCFLQMRNTADLKSSTILWCGITAGQFALAYLLQTTNSTARRRKTKNKHTYSSAAEPDPEPTIAEHDETSSPTISGGQSPRTDVNTFV